MDILCIPLPIHHGNISSIFQASYALSIISTDPKKKIKEMIRTGKKQD
jgi:hypothetical protein